MKPSKILQYFIPIFFLGFLFILGYSIGKNPDYFEKIDLTETEVYFYLEDQKILSEDNQRLLGKLSGTKIHFNEKPLEENELLLLNSKNIIKAWSIPTEKNKTLSGVFFDHEKISSDFKLTDIISHKALPLLWSITDKNSLETISLQLTPFSYRKKSPIYRILNSLTSAEFQEKWINLNAWNTTVVSHENSKIPDSKRPESIRKFQLNEIYKK